MMQNPLFRDLRYSISTGSRIWLCNRSLRRLKWSSCKLRGCLSDPILPPPQSGLPRESRPGSQEDTCSRNLSRVLLPEYFKPLQVPERPESWKSALSSLAFQRTASGSYLRGARALTCVSRCSNKPRWSRGPLKTRQPRRSSMKGARISALLSLLLTQYRQRFHDPQLISRDFSSRK
jgi:hypothetical protein